MYNSEKIRNYIALGLLYIMMLAPTVVVIWIEFAWLVDFIARGIVPNQYWAISGAVAMVFCMINAWCISRVGEQIENEIKGA